jgi:hypothetical protein
VKRASRLLLLLLTLGIAVWLAGHSDLGLIHQRVRLEPPVEVTEHWREDADPLAGSAPGPRFVLFPAKERAREAYAALCGAIREKLITPSRGVFAPLEEARFSEATGGEPGLLVSAWVESGNFEGKALRKELFALARPVPGQPGAWEFDYQFDKDPRFDALERAKEVYRRSLGSGSGR